MAAAASAHDGEIGKEEEQTARYSLAGWQQAQLRIIDDYQDRVRKSGSGKPAERGAARRHGEAHAAHFAAMYQNAEVMVAQDADAQMLAARS
jgi:hypothetical protein